MKLVHFQDIFCRAQQSMDATFKAVLERIFPRFKKEVSTSEKPLSRLTPAQRRLAIVSAVVTGTITTSAILFRILTFLERRRRLHFIQECEASEKSLFLFILPRSPWAPSLSPACTRVETFLRANGIPYTAIETIDPLGAPSGELPFLIYKRQRIDDLPKIMEFITSEFQVTMDDTLTRDQRATGAALRRLLEHNIEHYLYRIAFIDHPSLAIAQIERALQMPHLRARFAVYGYANNLKKRFATTAYGALVSEQYEHEFLQACESIEEQMGKKRYLFSDIAITSYDCAVYSLLVPFAYMGKHTSLSAAYSRVADSDVLMAYIADISRRLFSDVSSGFEVSNLPHATSLACAVDEHDGEAQ
ncbi:hypothetical protein JKF63_05644 [Porcisia hertigi]|uniref:Thioredoxin-like fold domain-containing protein n=1 Tax=Porcisia hertigi TaxID=2761500 RepID=A0A836IGB6_9TRYP|nr:hypothetical protein JKF63_05644 [Porcisia hertigi]